MGRKNSNAARVNRKDARRQKRRDDNREARGLDTKVKRVNAR